MTSTRGLHTRWQAKNTPMWPRFYDGQYWSRAFFIQRQTAIAIWQGLMLAFLCAVWQRHSSFLMASFISCPETLHQTGMRAILSLSMWLLFARLIGDFNYRIVSIISTALKTSDFQDWPPLFNSMLEAWTLRRFWGTFWHQCLRWPFCSAATVITRKGLGLQRPSLLERYTHILCVFVISGTLHTLCDLAFGIRWHESGALLFFSSFALGIMVEDGVQAVWRRITTAGTRSGNGLENKRKRKMHGGEVTPTWQKEVGFAWVTLWFTITTPSYLGKNWQALIADIDDVDLPFISDLYSWTLVLSLLVGAGFLRWRFGANV
ncbi:membrane bound O-acyl transferase family-domain-containing protein [Aspergillus spectabilis]